MQDVYISEAAVMLLLAEQGLWSLYLVIRSYADELIDSKGRPRLDICRNAWYRGNKKVIYAAAHWQNQGGRADL